MPWKHSRHNKQKRWQAPQIRSKAVPSMTSHQNCLNGRDRFMEHSIEPLRSDFSTLDPTDFSLLALDFRADDNGRRPQQLYDVTHRSAIHSNETSSVDSVECGGGDVTRRGITSDTVASFDRELNPVEREDMAKNKNFPLRVRRYRYVPSCSLEDDVDVTSFGNTFDSNMTSARGVGHSMNRSKRLPAISLGQRLIQVHDSSSSPTISVMHSSRARESTYVNPVEGAPKTYKQRVGELIALELKTIRWERRRRSKNNK